MEEIFKNSKKIIIKIGSSTITGEDGKIDYEFLENLASEVKTLVGLGKQAPRRIRYFRTRPESNLSNSE